MSRQVIKCDVCYVRGWPAIMWTYEIEPFGFEFPQSPDPRYRSYIDDGFWAFCDDCHELVAAGNWQGLLTRSELMDPPAADFEREWRRRMHQGFKSAKRRCAPYRGHPASRLPVDGSSQAKWN